MTKNLKILAGLSLIWSVAFFSVLNWALYNPDQRWPFITVAAITYGLGFGLAGWQLGKRDSARPVRYNLGFAYSMTSNLASLLVGSLWVLLFRQNEWPTLVIMLVIFSLVTLILGITGKNDIKGIPKDRLFK